MVLTGNNNPEFIICIVVDVDGELMNLCYRCFFEILFTILMFNVYRTTIS